MQSKKLVILTEAGGSVGYGHLARCSAIAEYYSNSTLLVNKKGDMLPVKNAVNLDWISEPDKLKKYLSKNSVILIDSYLADLNVYKSIHKYGSKTVVLDDYNRINYPADIIINPGVGLPDYSDQEASLLVGSKYIILRKELINLKTKRHYSRNINNIFLILGGADHLEQLVFLLEILKPYKAHVSVVTGMSQQTELLKNRYINHDMTFYCNLNATEISGLMLQADLAISAGGQILHELAFFGTPVIAIQTGEDQVMNMKGYYEKGFLPEILEFKEENLDVKIKSSISKYLSYDKRKYIGNLGNKIVDGKGITRILHEIIN